MVSWAPCLPPCRFRFRRALWVCVLGPGLGCAQPFLAGLSGCVFCAFFFLVFLSRALMSLSSHPLSFGLGWWLSFFFFFFSVSLFPVGRCFWLGVPGFWWVVPLCLFGGLVFGANTSNPLFNCPHALKTYFTQCQHLETPFQLP